MELLTILNLILRLAQAIEVMLMIPGKNYLYQRNLRFARTATVSNYYGIKFYNALPGRN